MDLRKSNDVFDREKCTEILVTYGVRSRTERLLHRYWEGSTMVPMAGLYYGAPFKGSRRVMQVDLLYPTIFNMVIVTVI